MGKRRCNLQQLPYELLIVNVSTIGIHFLTGVLLTIGVLLKCGFKEYSLSLEKYNQIRRHL